MSLLLLSERLKDGLSKVSLLIVQNLLASRENDISKNIWYGAKEFIVYIYIWKHFSDGAIFISFSQKQEIYTQNCYCTKPFLAKIIFCQFCL